MNSGGNNFLEFTNTGPSPELAAAGVLNRREALRRTGFHAGSVYGYRIAPQWIRVNREYYTKGSPVLKRAGRLARTNNWEEAAKIWELHSRNNRKKIAGRSTYNMAIAREVQGNLDDALIWARKSYTDFGIRKGNRYANILQRRIRDRERLNQQMM